MKLKTIYKGPLGLPDLQSDYIFEVVAGNEQLLKSVEVRLAGNKLLPIDTGASNFLFSLGEGGGLVGKVLVMLLLVWDVNEDSNDTNARSIIRRVGVDESLLNPDYAEEVVDQDGDAIIYCVKVIF
ncbi:hypothetical protein [Pelagicoccus sp. SDUM812002]|uniref:hypothetical protein n=1 Tax=Pelagicoccus sp. SDUM812002 TaxID=3041266 RepID=UPI00280E328E|nr:hypothetical protein [Pelagicoccus sp. SDUM812002]MDQ8185805.1 hypothetical protein [Pelagicoccus sp. SDUM812002]